MPAISGENLRGWSVQDDNKTRHAGTVLTFVGRVYTV